MRAPDQVLGDIHAQLAANATGGRRLLELMRECHLEELMPLAEVLHARSEAAMRTAIARIPDGAYRHVVMTDGFDVPIEIHCMHVHARRACRGVRCSWITPAPHRRPNAASVAS